MLIKDDVLNYLKLYKEQKKEQYSIGKLGIFGSLARGENREDSDIDVVVSFDKPDLLNQAGIMIELREHFNRDVDVVSLWSGMNPRLKKRIEQDVIYV